MANRALRCVTLDDWRLALFFSGSSSCLCQKVTFPLIFCNPLDQSPMNYEERKEIVGNSLHQREDGDSFHILMYLYVFVSPADIVE